MPLVVEQDVLRLQVPVDDLFVVQVLNGEEQLSNVEAGLMLRKGDFPSQMEAQVLARTVVESQVEVVRSLKGEVQVDDEGMAGLLEDVGLDDGVLELLLHDEVFLL